MYCHRKLQPLTLMNVHACAQSLKTSLQSNYLIRVPVAVPKLLTDMELPNDGNSSVEIIEQLSREM